MKYAWTDYTLIYFNHFNGRCTMITLRSSEDYYQTTKVRRTKLGHEESWTKMRRAKLQCKDSPKKHEGRSA